MGQFSWLDCKTGEQVLDDVARDSYVLIPKEFGGGHVHEACYDGYGHFGTFDVHELVAEWNRSQLTESMLLPVRKESYGGLYGFEKDAMRERGASEEDVQKADNAEQEKHYQAALRRKALSLARMADYRSGQKSDNEMFEEYGRDWKRLIGIDIACYDEQNAALPYPIKITHDASAVYEDCEPSLSDPDQGWAPSKDIEDDERDW